MYLTDWNFDKVKYDELVNIIHPDLLIIPVKFVFFMNAVHESAIQDTWELPGSRFLRKVNFFKIFPDIIKFTREKSEFIFYSLSFSNDKSFCSFLW